MNELKYLGINQQRTLNWNSHINQIIKKTSKNIGVIKKVSKWIPKENLIQLYFALIYSQFKYCITIWGKLNRTNLHRVQKIQNKVIKIIKGKNCSQVEIKEFCFRHKIQKR